MLSFKPFLTLFKMERFRTTQGWRDGQKDILLKIRYAIIKLDTVTP